MHPLGLCNNNDEEDLYEYGWVGVVKLEQPELDPSCLTVLGKVKEKFDVASFTDGLLFGKQLRERESRFRQGNSLDSHNKRPAREK